MVDVYYGTVGALTDVDSNVISVYASAEVGESWCAHDQIGWDTGHVYSYQSGTCLRGVLWASD
jgi:hypothetical protein